MRTLWGKGQVTGKYVLTISKHFDTLHAYHPAANLLPGGVLPVEKLHFFLLAVLSRWLCGWGRLAWSVHPPHTLSRQLPAIPKRTRSTQAKEKIESWSVEYNQVRPHSSLGNTTPEAFAERFKNLRSGGWTLTPVGIKTGAGQCCFVKGMRTQRTR